MEIKTNSLKFYEPEKDSELLLKNTINLIDTNLEKDNLRLLEVGVGSGYVISNIAKKFKNKLEYFGCDINSDAIKETEKKFKENKQKITLKKSDLLTEFEDEFDYIIFNTPYLPCESNDNYNNLKLIDKAIYGGKNGYEVIERFISSIKSHLSYKGFGLMVFSSLSNLDYILDVLKKNIFEFEIVEKENVFFEELICLKFWRKEFYFEVIENGVIDLKYLSAGKHSIVYQGKYKLKNVVIKVGLEKDLSIEKYYLEKLIKEKFVPKIYFSGKEFVVREKVEGELIGEFLEKRTKTEIEYVLDKILEITCRMDELKINKKEMTNPYKHIYILKKNNDFQVKMIDYERCIFTEKPKNTTQFLQYLRKNSTLLKSKKINLNETKIFDISQEYKKKVENGQNEILQLSDLLNN